MALYTKVVVFGVNTGPLKFSPECSREKTKCHN